MGEWVIGAFINLFGSIAINFGTNLLKLGHDERERHSVVGNDGAHGKALMKPIIYFQTWRIVPSCSSRICPICVKHCIRLLCAEQNCDCQSTCCHSLYCSWEHLPCGFWKPPITRRGELLLAIPGNDIKPYWHMLLPLSYAIVSGAVGSCSVLFAKSLSNLLRLSISSGYQLHSWFMYSILLLFFTTAGFWMARLNEGLSLFDAILIVPMFQIVWTFFSICTGFVYFQEYQVFDALRTTMFILGMISVFIGISLLAPDESKGILSGGEIKDTALVSVTTNHPNDADSLIMPSEDSQIKDMKSLVCMVQMKAASLIVKTKAACSLSLGLGEESIHASSVLVMPMVSSKINGFRGNVLDRTKLFL
ncbi:UNVERIFIED_CONTAM: putative magnesium transporter NIPA8 [Sesamum radiatum]|uniref:Probable magnesium transporter n=1 Tax=Sesamum radiatum TaxID=300843 RepID=A0AAW2RBU0_SESRA